MKPKGTSRRYGLALALTVVAVLVAIPVVAERASAGNDAAESAAVWKAVASSGKVEARDTVDDATTWKRVARGDELMPRTQLKTGRSGRATLANKTHLIIVDPMSQIELPVEKYAGEETSVVQTSGSVLYEVDGKKTPHFEVVTPYLVAGVKGTVFLVTVNDDYASVSVERGLVEVTDAFSGDMMEVHAGEAVMRDAEAYRMEVMDVHARAEKHRARVEAKKMAKLERRRDEHTKAVHQAKMPGNELTFQDVASKDPGIRGELKSDGFSIEGTERRGIIVLQNLEDFGNELGEEQRREDVAILHKDDDSRDSEDSGASDRRHDPPPDPVGVGNGGNGTADFQGVNSTAGGQQP